jgi:8-oxo-dGTP pyrophosphatase MutT (NUDIX family)
MRLQLYTPELIQMLHEHPPFDAREASHLQRMIDFVGTSLAPFSRGNKVGHITASAVLLNETRSHVLLVWHEKLRRWLQPGGHCEEGLDETTHDAAFRELIEETSGDPSTISLIQKKPLDIDIHVIPATSSEREHLHYDIRYAFVTPCADNYSGLPDLRWKPINEMSVFADESIARFSRKVTLLINNGTAP